MARDSRETLGRQGVSLEVREEGVPGRMEWALESMLFRSQPIGFRDTAAIDDTRKSHYVGWSSQM